MGKMFMKQVFLYDKNLSYELHILSYININFMCVNVELCATRYTLIYRNVYALKSLYITKLIIVFLERGRLC